MIRHEQDAVRGKLLFGSKKSNSIVKEFEYRGKTVVIDKNQLGFGVEIRHKNGGLMLMIANSASNTLEEAIQKAKEAID